MSKQLLSPVSNARIASTPRYERLGRSPVTGHYILKPVAVEGAQVSHEDVRKVLQHILNPAREVAE